MNTADKLARQRASKLASYHRRKKLRVTPAKPHTLDWSPVYLARRAYRIVQLQARFQGVVL